MLRFNLASELTSAISRLGIWKYLLPLIMQDEDDGITVVTAHRGDYFAIIFNPRQNSRTHGGCTCENAGIYSIIVASVYGVDSSMTDQCVY